MTKEEIIDGLELYTVGRLKKERVYITVEELQKYIDEIKALEQDSKWIPVSNPRGELPKDRILWVTIDIGGYLAVRTLYYDMTEWSDDLVDYVVAYMDYVEPEPYKAESEGKE